MAYKVPHFELVLKHTTLDGRKEVEEKIKLDKSVVSYLNHKVISLAKELYERAQEGHAEYFDERGYVQDTIDLTMHKLPREITDCMHEGVKELKKQQQE